MTNHLKQISKSNTPTSYHFLSFSSDFQKPYLIQEVPRRFNWGQTTDNEHDTVCIWPRFANQELNDLLQVDGSRDGRVLPVGWPREEAWLHCDSILWQGHMQPIQVLTWLYRCDRTASLLSLRWIQGEFRGASDRVGHQREQKTARVQDRGDKELTIESDPQSTDESGLFCCHTERDPTRCSSIRWSETRRR